ncbi:MAG TPA: FKBP-type peptidyl-prolyl cis-trans isomerase [Allosphingosinicella sp.]|nr:FKBP-type peptidyl-prolyl cis-trans isomerase [Allosphingosinicella sp.]
MLLVAFLLAAAAPSAPALKPSRSGVVTTASGLRFKTLKRGSGPRPTVEDAVLVDYVGRLANGKVFDRSGDKPVGFPVGGVVPGFAEALMMMNVGGKYRFWIPPQLAYGNHAAGTIPPNSTLEFTVTLRRIGRAIPAPVEARPGTH